MDLYIDLDLIGKSYIKELTNVRFHDITIPNIIQLLDIIKKGLKSNKKYTFEPKNIIIYINNKYANDYRNKLKNLGFKTINTSIIKQKENCVDISTFKLPLFS